MVEDTSKSPAGNGSGAELGDEIGAPLGDEIGAPLGAPSDADSGEQIAPESRQQEIVREKEIGGRGGLDPTRYGEWEKAGRCIDF